MSILLFELTFTRMSICIPLRVVLPLTVTVSVTDVDRNFENKIETQHYSYEFRLFKICLVFNLILGNKSSCECKN